MFENHKILAIIPARGGSKRLPGKNLLKLCGKPLIQWTIDSAINSEFIDKIIVSSDDKTILEISENLGATSLQRPDLLASDTATTISVIEHVVSIYQEYDTVLLLQPTSPLRTAKHIDEALNYYFKINADAVISVCETEHSPLWTNTLPSDNSMTGFINKELLNKRSQDLEKYYRLNGAIYICDKIRLLTEKTFFLDKYIFAFIMGRECSVDIDEETDFLFAESLLNHRVHGI